LLELSKFKIGNFTPWKPANLGNFQIAVGIEGVPKNDSYQTEQNSTVTGYRLPPEANESERRFLMAFPPT